MTKIVINTCYGGFGLSPEAFARYRELGGLEEYEWDIKRTDPCLIQAVEEFAEKAWGNHAELEIQELSSGTKYVLREYDGIEWLETIDSIEWEVA